MSIEDFFPYYEATPFFSLQSDKRLSYCLYVPAAYHRADVAEVSLIVALHGTRRTAEGYDAFARFAERTNSVVLAPLFPIGVTGSYAEAPEEAHNYKYLDYQDIRFDLALLNMVSEVRKVLDKVAERFLLFGFSGGGQFAHRFYYLHPSALRGVSIGAPGTVTRLMPEVEWWPGIGGVANRFGTAIDVEALRQVPVQLVVGSRDTETWNVRVKEGSWTWRPGANDAGENRVQRLKALRDNLEAHDIEVEHAVVDGVGHSGLDVLEPVFTFFEKCLGERGAS